MKVAFRCDASLDIGSGHVMRCLTLAGEIVRHGGTCHFICRELPGNLRSLVTAQGHAVTVLEQPAQTCALAGYEAWLGVPLAQDGAETAQALRDVGGADWLVADHYAISRPWEEHVAPCVSRIMVIDDLADRPHHCNLLLDQSLGRTAGDYDAFTDPRTVVLCGTRYALLRPEFAQLRDASLERRSSPVLHDILVTMGGVDRDNATGEVLESLAASSLASDISVTVVMGKTAPWLERVKEQASTLRFPCRVLCGVSTMAELMRDADLAVGAVGSTSWERCALGLPAIVAILAENQSNAARQLEQAGAIRLFKTRGQAVPGLAAHLEELATNPAALVTMSNSAANLVDGLGCTRVAEWILEGYSRHVTRELNDV